VYVGVLVGVREGVGLGVGERLGVADGLGVALDGVGEGWLAVGDGAAADEAAGVGEGTDVLVGVGELLACAATCPACVDAAAIMIPATIATMPPMAPPTSPRMVQVEAGRVPDVGPSPVTGVTLWGLHWHGRDPFPASGPGRLPRQEYPACPRQAQPTKAG
jgi:hypothetical protein